jgi:hypothetical protein
MLFGQRTEGIMSGGYVIARENFKEAEKHVSAETDPVMFNLLYGLQSLTTQLESDFAVLQVALTSLNGPTVEKKPQQKSRTKKPPAKKARGKAARRSR